MQYTFLQLTMVVFVMWTVGSVKATLRAHDMLVTMIEEQNYDEQSRPNLSGDPVNVSVGILITSIHSISEISMDYGSTLFMSIHWSDPRLQFKGDEPIRLRSGSELYKRVWIPDLYFVNVKKAALHDVTETNTHIRIYPDGWIVYDLRVSLLLVCHMYLERFPMDSQSCTIKIESFIYNTDDIRLNWGWGRTGNVTAIMDSEVSLPGFTLHETTTTKQEIPFPMGIYDRLICRFDLYRQIIYYVMEYYVPSFLLVILSWVSFWLSVESTPARASLGITTVLTLTTLSSLARTQLPRITYLTAIDVWILVCSLFVFAALLEFAVASYVAIHFNKSYSTSRSCHNRAKSSAEQVSVMATLSSSDMEEGKASLTRRSFRSSKTGSSNCTATLIDNCSRVLFPVSFILFNVVYWLKYGLVL